MEMSSKKYGIAVYYVFVVIAIFIFSIALPFKLSEVLKIEYMNARLSELKEATRSQYVDENSESVKSIFAAGHSLFKDEYKNLSGKLGLLTCAVVLAFTIFFRFTRLLDILVVGGIYFVLYAYGSMSTEYFVFIALFIFTAYQLKRKRNNVGVQN